MSGNHRSWLILAMPPAVALSLLVVAIVLANGCGTAVSGERQRAATGAAEGASPEFVVYYLHGDMRCRTCRSIEAMAEKVVRERFADELERGRLAWRVINFDRPENRHFVDDFGLTSSSLVVVDRRPGHERHLVLDRVWMLVRDPLKFKGYVSQTLERFLRG